MSVRKFNVKFIAANGYEDEEEVYAHSAEDAAHVFKFLAPRRSVISIDAI